MMSSSIWPASPWRKLLLACLTIAVVALGTGNLYTALFLKNPPRWTGLIGSFVWALIGIVVLLFPEHWRLSAAGRRFFAGFLFAFSAVNLIMFFVKGL